VTEVVVELPQSLRHKLKGAMGPIFTDTEELLDSASDPLIAVGDMVTYHLLEAGRVPDVALVDEHTERTQVEADVWDAISGFDREVVVSNPAATLTAELLTALQEAIERAGDESTLVVVDGEEDLASLPALVAAPMGASIVYGQPGEGMVLVEVKRETTDRARDLLSQMDGDTRRLWSVLAVGD
jgi:uncharacterized protein (UPF0218 family)